ncbi:hypothetical protein A9P82_02200 [Arachidicoccus ginsenosidimutans]|uniref:BatD family protein n=1 Tax=Arachidicoccus sp. BS20 TaxID=1850526 RepID=UPI0007F141F5|nr:BatD family protein [Arachidicoccus sp. BS20]ANI88221.1 hypothetical protein A9P82_02200 [Arachidicoccus sp. BS20]
MNKRKIFATGLTALFILLAIALHAQTLSLSVSAKTIGSRDVLEATYSFSGVNSASQPSPDFKDWNAVGTNESSETNIINGKVSSSYNYTFELMPKHSGTLTVPGITVSVNGKQLSCNAVIVNVSDKAHLQNNNNNSSAGAQNSPFAAMQQMQQQMQQMMNDMGADDNYPQQPTSGVVVHNGQSLDDAVKDKILIRIIPSKTTCYVGEPISVDYEICTSVPCNITPSRIPSFGSFSVTDLKQAPSVHNVEINGKTYRAQSLRTAQLVALKTGNLPLDQAIVNCQFNYTDVSNPMGAYLGSAVVKSKPLTIHVLPLPANKPADFSGAVGQFSITATVDKNSLPAQENNTLHLQIKGLGTLDGVTLPQISFPENIQSYDAKDSQSVDKSQLPMVITRAFDIPFIGNAKGVSVIPPIKFSYFDTKKNDYETVATDSIKIAFSAPIATDDNPEKPVVQNEGNMQSLWIVAGLAIIVLLYLFLRERKINKQKLKDKKEIPEAVVKEENIVTENAEMPLDETPTLSEEDRAAIALEKKEKLKESLLDLELEVNNHQFFVLAKALLIQHLQDSLHADSTNEHELLQKLDESEMKNTTEIKDLFARCNKALYMPVVSSAEHDEVLKKLKATLV